MPLRVRCPRCGQTAEITEDQLGRQGQCNNCGSLVAIPARLSKVCFACRSDLTHLPHAKDPQGNYLCTPCYETRHATDPIGHAAHRLECSICHVRFPRDQALGSIDEPICRDCATILQSHQSTLTIPIASERQPTATALADAPLRLEELEQLEPVPRPPIPQIYTAPTPQLTRPRSISAPTQRLPLILSSIALAGVVILAVLHFTSIRKDPLSQNVAHSAPTESPDQQMLTRILILKSQAEVLIEVGKLREGIDKYDELLRISSLSPTILAEQESARPPRQQALKLLAASTTRPTTSTASDVKPPPTPDPQKKPGTIFDE